MKNPVYVFTILLFTFLYSCSPKTVPTENPPPNTSESTSKKDTLSSTTIITDSVKTAAPTPAKVAVVKTPVPKSITVNDQAAKKTADGRYYYDLEGKRYWRNKKDGKYYLYYKGMFENKNFQK